MEPGNPEYQSALNRMVWQQQGRTGTRYGNYRNAGNYRQMDTCDCCSSLICADCCCECMGGDLISCC